MIVNLGRMQPSGKPGHELLSFINASPSPFHAVASTRHLLEKAGFVEVKERSSWAETCRPGGKYFLTRNGSTLVAFAIGKKFKPGCGFSIIGAHTDSPCLRIKPVSKKQNAGFLEVGVETYGGGRWSTWFDRDLSIAGRVLAREYGNRIVQKLIKIDRPILKIPTLAIHLERTDPLPFNKETHLLPIAGLVAAELQRGTTTSKDDTTAKSSGEAEALFKTVEQRHHPYLVELIAKEAQVTPSAIEDFELILYDTQKACISGMHDDFMSSARLDNLCMSYCAASALACSCEDPSSLDDETTTRVVALFDHEEVGSTSAQGADSDTLPAILRRLCAIGHPSSSSSSDDAASIFEQSLAGSFLVSADMAHSVHPNFTEKYESNHYPLPNKGTVLKINANARYMTNSPGIVLMQQVARKANVPLQSIVVRNDSTCGSTIGPMLAAKLGARTVDLGNATLGMHSIREMAGLYDVDLAQRLFRAFFEHYAHLEGNIVID